MSTFAIVLIVAALYMTVNGDGAKDCSPAKNMADLDVNKLVSYRVWYLVHETSENPNSCIKEAFNRDSGPETLTLVYSDFNGETYSSDSYTANITDLTAPIAFIDDIDKTKNITTNIFATDYNNYLIFVECSIKENKPVFSVEVLSQKKPLADDKLKEVHKLLQDAAIPDALITLDLSECD